MGYVVGYRIVDVLITNSEGIPSMNNDNYMDLINITDQDLMNVDPSMDSASDLDRLVGDMLTTSMEYISDLFNSLEQDEQVILLKETIQKYGYTSPMAILGAETIERVCSSTGMEFDKNLFSVNNGELLIKGCEASTKVSWADKMLELLSWLLIKIKELFDTLANGAKSMIVRAEALLRLVRLKRVSVVGTERFSGISDEVLQKSVYGISKTTFNELEFIIRDRFNVLASVERFAGYGGELHKLMGDGNVVLSRDLYTEKIRTATRNGVLAVTRNMHINDMNIRRMLNILQPKGGAEYLTLAQTEWTSEEAIAGAIAVCQNYAKQLLSHLRFRTEMERLYVDTKRGLDNVILRSGDMTPEAIRHDKQIAQNMLNGCSNTLIVLTNLILQIKRMVTFILHKFNNMEIFLANNRVKK